MASKTTPAGRPEDPEDDLRSQLRALCRLRGGSHDLELTDGLQDAIADLVEAARG